MPAFARTLMMGLPALCSPGIALACALCSCSITINTPINFGNYNPASTANNDVTGQITFTCGGLTLATSIAYEIRMSRGTANSYAPRQMAGPGGARLNYNLFTTAARATVWGDGTGGSSFVSGSGTVPGLLGSLTRSVNVFGRAPPGQYVRAGAYTDSIIVTVSY